MKKTIIVLAFLSLIPFAGISQKVELGVFGGLGNYQGDLAPVAFTLREFRPAGGGLIRYNVNRFFSVRGALTFGSVSGDDGKALIEWRNYRNLSFKTHIAEAAILAEYFVFGMEDCGNKKFSPYGFAGIGIYNFNPQAYYQGQWIDLQPLGTEGQGTSIYPEREKYALTQICIPFGVGIKYRTPLGFNIATEMGWRKLFTDYIDDVSNSYVDREIMIAENGHLANALSNRTVEVLPPNRAVRGHGEQRGDPTQMDWYFFGGVILSYTIGPKCEERTGVGCPNF